VCLSQVIYVLLTQLAVPVKAAARAGRKALTARQRSEASKTVGYSHFGYAPLSLHDLTAQLRAVVGAQRSPDAPGVCAFVGFARASSQGTP
jgi:prolyl-tRNA editing enzyme YbaK/EbsC (Cys-tRNA(Pro) deacylase)